MKNIVFVGLISLLIFSCSKKESLPECLEGKVMNTAVLVKKIHVQTVNGEKHYWMETGALASDGVDVVLSSKCDTLCYIGGIGDSKCTVTYDSDAWEVIWTR